MAQRQDLHRDADLHAARAGGDRRGDRQRRRQMGALGGEMDFGQPHRIETMALGGIDLRHALVERFRVAAPGQRRKLVKHAEFHERLLDPAGS